VTTSPPRDPALPEDAAPDAAETEPAKPGEATDPGPGAEAAAAGTPEPGAEEPAPTVSLEKDPSPAAVTPEPDGTAEAEPDAVSETEAPTLPEAEPGEPVAAPRRRRTARLLLVAALLGVVAGGGTGYAIQAARTPTPPPPLTVAQPVYPAAHGGPSTLSAADDDMVKTDGDLTKLILPPPSGSKPWAATPGENGWLTLSEFAEDFTGPADEFQWLLSRGFRRAAVSTWLEGDVSYRINLIQYEHDSENVAEQYVQSQDSYRLNRVGGGAYRTAIPGTEDGAVYDGPKQQQYDDGSGSYYGAYALARHGDLAVEIFVTSPNRIDQATVMHLVQSQLERL
jgi:hypothetical protein